MVINDKNINRIELKDIEKLITEKISEDKFLEYKCQLDNGEKDKILKTICGFANADGGLFIYGLEEKNGEPQKITGVSLNGKSWDDKKIQIQNWIYRSIEPHLNVELNMLKIVDDKCIILIKVPKSWNPPHCVKNKANRLFYIRRDGSTNSMDYDELRQMFDLNNSLIEKINDFRDKRVSYFEFETQEKYKVIFHAIPLNTFSNNQINLEKAQKKLMNGEIIGGFYRPNFEGLYEPTATFFRQFYRNGIYEMHYTQYNQIEKIPLKYLEEEYLKFTEEILDFYQEINILCPIIFFVSLTNIQNHELDNNGLPMRTEVFDKKRSLLNPKGIVITNKTQIEPEIHNLFIPLWNHFGISKKYKKEDALNEK